MILRNHFDELSRNTKSFSVIVQYLYAICEESVLNGMFHRFMIGDINDLKEIIFPLHAKIDFKYNWLIGYQRALNIAKYGNDVYIFKLILSFWKLYPM